MAYGMDSSQDPRRQVTRDQRAQSVASKLHYEHKLRAANIENMSDDQFSQLMPDAGIDRGSVVHRMRAYEHYALPE